MAILGLIFSSLASASQIQVSPVKLEFLPGQRVQQLRLGNPGDRDMVLQIELFLWDQVKGKNSLSPNRNFLATPPILDVAAHSRKVVRIGPRKPPGGECEVSYRVVVTEIPPQAGANKRPVRFRSQVSLPLFARNGDDCQARLGWQRQGDTLTLRNSGNGYSQILSAQVKTPTRQWPLELPDVGYVLAGRQRMLRLPEGLPADARLMLKTVHGEVAGPLAQFQP